MFFLFVGAATWPLPTECDNIIFRKVAGDYYFGAIHKTAMAAKKKSVVLVVVAASQRCRDRRTNKHNNDDISKIRRKQDKQLAKMEAYNM